MAMVRKFDDGAKCPSTRVDSNAHRAPLNYNVCVIFSSNLYPSMLRHCMRTDNSFVLDFCYILST